MFQKMFRGDSQIIPKPAKFRSAVHLQRFLIVGLSCILSVGFILSGFGGVNQTSDTFGSKKYQSSVLGVDEVVSSNKTVCPVEYPILGVITKSGDKKIVSMVTSDTQTYKCFVSIALAIEEGYKE